MIVRHAQAEGQAADAKLTEEGQKQAEELAGCLKGQSIQRIVSSPFQRAVQTIQPLGEKLAIPIEKDQRLTERTLSTEHLPDWLEKLKETFFDPNLSFSGGESGNKATKRVIEVVEDIFNRQEKTTVVVTHGGLMALLLRHYNPDYGFEDWLNLGNPDVYVLTKTDSQTSVKRMALNNEASAQE